MIPEWLRFVGVNALGLVIDLGSAIILISLGVNVYIAASVSFTAAAALNYRLHSIWTFDNAGKRDHGGAHKFAAFYVAALITILVRLIALAGLKSLDLPYVIDRESELLIMATGISIMANYIACKRLIFTR